MGKAIRGALLRERLHSGFESWRRYLRIHIDDGHEVFAGTPGKILKCPPGRADTGDIQLFVRRLIPESLQRRRAAKAPLGTAAESSGPYRKYVRRADGRAVVELFTAIYRSSHTGMPVCLPL